MYEHLRTTDPDIAAALDAELARQRAGLGLIASENISSAAVLEALGSPLNDKYSEGYPGRRYYGGNANADAVESAALARACALYGAEHANVQPHAGSQANLAAYLALAPLGGKILAMDLAHGGHLTHGSPATLVGKAWKFAHYGVSRGTDAPERIDMDEVRAIALQEKPTVIVAGFTAYPRHLDFAAFRAIADEVGAYLMTDMAHFAGLVAAKLHPDPVPYSDVVTTTTHKTLRGPRGAMILCRKEDRYAGARPDGGKRTLAQRVDSAVFPGTQGGPLEHVIAAKAVALREAAMPEFRAYQERTLANARALAESLAAEGVRLVSGGTDNHLVLADLTPLGIGGADAEAALEAVGIYANKNMIPFDTRKPLDPSGLRLGTPALTTRGVGTDEMREIGGIIARVLRAPTDAAVHRAAATRVQEISAAHPAYPELA